ncbi:hypothetical protein JCM30471_11990 [Desulfuromonas carbonis]|uniref:Ig-like domain-containing protein n=1 Tax=Desulfuromonas sp. DDH964 TaxID=1823759 RepID=UPI00078C9579|nr:Ig-like domain-containing protein [Desulfuromonas sp. DDH964]AMV72683.1 NHL repeat domain-containing protein [Desulfuromonas sp. DDH964]
MKRCNIWNGMTLVMGLLLSGLLLTSCGSSQEDLVAPRITFDGAAADTTSRTRYLSGTVEAGATVEVTLGNDLLPASQVHVSGGYWSCVIDNLAAGSNLVSVTAVDAIGNQNILSFFLVYDLLTIDTYVSPLPGTSQTIGGQVDPALAAPEVTLNSVVVGNGTVSGNRWSFDLTGLVEGSNALEVSVTHPVFGLVKKNLTLQVNTLAPIITIDPVVTPTVAADQNLSGSYTTAPVVSVATATPGTLNAAAGLWDLSLSALAAGKNIVITSDSANNITATARTLITQQLVADRIPHPGAFDVAAATTVSVTFPVAMAAATITDSSFTLSAGDPAVAVAAVVTYDDASRTATLTPVSPLAPGTVYTATLLARDSNGGVLPSAITDLSGQPLARNVSWFFTTL